MAERDQALAQYRTVVDQRHLAEALGPDREWWPCEWVVSFKRHCIPTFPRNRVATPRLPPEARIVVFHGRPNPHEALAGYRSDRPHRSCLRAPWIALLWSPSEVSPETPIASALTPTHRNAVGVLPIHQA